VRELWWQGLLQGETKREKRTHGQIIMSKSVYLVFSNLHSKKTLEALIPEAEEGMKGIEVDISLDPPSIRINAEETSALRAALNSYLRWLKISENITTVYNK